MFITKDKFIGCLEKAINEIDEVVVALDVDETACKECGLSKKSNWQEYKMAKELTAVIQKLKNLIKGKIC